MIPTIGEGVAQQLVGQPFKVVDCTIMIMGRCNKCDCERLIKMLLGQVGKCTQCGAVFVFARIEPMNIQAFVNQLTPNADGVIVP